jgi:hypothetical protein
MTIGIYTRSIYLQIPNLTYNNNIYTGHSVENGNAPIIYIYI